MGSARLIWFSVLSLRLLSLSVFSFSVCYLVLLLEGCPMTLFVHLPVAVEGSAAVESLRIHRPIKPVVPVLKSVPHSSAVWDPGSDAAGDARNCGGLGVNGEEGAEKERSCLQLHGAWNSSSAPSNTSNAKG